MVVSLLIGLLVCYCSLLRLIYSNESISIYFEILKCRHCLNYLVITLSIAFPAFEVFQVDICKQFATLHEVGRLSFHSLQNTHCFLDVSRLDSYHSIGQQYMDLLSCSCELTDSLRHNSFAFFSLFAFCVALGQ